VSGRWANSTRTYDLPPDWGRRRVRILRRDPHCTLALPDRCTVTSTEVDHINGRHNHDDSNLQGVCHECHEVKTQAEAADGRAAARARKPRRRPREQHPGLIR
jgi:5-methylcytosine-specific restriction protein A